MCLKAGFNNADVILQFFVREVSMTDFYRSEQTQAMVGYASDKIMKTQGAEDDELVYE